MVCYHSYSILSSVDHQQPDESVDLYSVVNYFIEYYLPDGTPGFKTFRSIFKLLQEEVAKLLAEQYIDIIVSNDEEMVYLNSQWL